MKLLLFLLLLFSLLPAQIIEQQAMIRGDTIRKVIAIDDKLKVTQTYVKTDTLDVVEPMSTDEISLEKISANKLPIKDHQ